MSKKRKFDKIETGIFDEADIDPSAPVDKAEIDAQINKFVKKEAATNALHQFLLAAKPNYEEATGKPAGGKRRKSRRIRTKKSTFKKSTFKKSRAKRRAK